MGKRIARAREWVGMFVTRSGVTVTVRGPVLRRVHEASVQLARASHATPGQHTHVRITRVPDLPPVEHADRA